jgi:hypothetical protein
MAAVHRSLAVVLLVAAGVFIVGAIVAALRHGSRPWLEWLRRTLTVLVVLETLAGIVVYGSGHRPDESLHLVYGLAAVVALPFGSYFAAEASSRPRAAVLGATGILTLGVFFRSFATG